MPRPHSRLTNRMPAPAMPGKLLRRCKKCDAAPGHQCGKLTSNRGWVTVKNLHKER
jgi:hypothetical protein